MFHLRRVEPKGDASQNKKHLARTSPQETTLRSHFFPFAHRTVPGTLPIGVCQQQPRDLACKKTWQVVTMTPDFTAVGCSRNKPASFTYSVRLTTPPLPSTPGPLDHAPDAGTSKEEGEGRGRAGLQGAQDAQIGEPARSCIDPTNPSQEICIKKDARSLSRHVCA